MRLPWSVLGLVGAIASSIPLASSHEIHLAYLPAIESENHIHSYLSVKWSMQGGSLYANSDRVFPPSTSMQVHAPQYDSVKNTRMDKQVELVYSLDARPLSSREVGAPNSIVRVSVELFDQTGNSVTPNAVILDLLDHPDGNLRIAKIRMEAVKSQQMGESNKQRPSQMKYWQSEMELLSKTPKKQDSSKLEPEAESNANSESSNSIINDSNPSQSKDVANANPTGVTLASTVGYIFSPYFAPASYSSSRHAPSKSGHRHPHGRPRDQTFMHLIRPVVLPAFLGAMAGLVACLVGFIIGHVFMSVSYRLGLRKRQQRRQQSQHRRSRTSAVEDGTILEKSELVPTIIITEIDDIDHV